MEPTKRKTKVDDLSETSVCGDADSQDNAATVLHDHLCQPHSITDRTCAGEIRTITKYPYKWWQPASLV